MSEIIGGGVSLYTGNKCSAGNKCILRERGSSFGACISAGIRGVFERALPVLAEGGC